MASIQVASNVCFPFLTQEQTDALTEEQRKGILRRWVVRKVLASWSEGLHYQGQMENFLIQVLQIDAFSASLIIAFSGSLILAESLALRLFGSQLHFNDVDDWTARINASKQVMIDFFQNAGYTDEEVELCRSSLTAALDFRNSMVAHWKPNQAPGNLADALRSVRVAIKFMHIMTISCLPLVDKKKLNQFSLVKPSAQGVPRWNPAWAGPANQPVVFDEATVLASLHAIVLYDGPLMGQIPGGNTAFAVTDEMMWHVKHLAQAVLREVNGPALVNGVHHGGGAGRGRGAGGGRGRGGRGRGGRGGGGGRGRGGGRGGGRGAGAYIAPDTGTVVETVPNCERHWRNYVSHWHWTRENIFLELVASITPNTLRYAITDGHPCPSGMKF